ncbi:MAG: ABC transporter ATP-binding protein [Blastochloris sp.]|nr:ABC transporter ATP-binding protein [Blastochloris sp.]
MNMVRWNLPARLYPARRAGRGSGIWQLLVILRPHYWLMAITIASGVLKHGATIGGAALGAYLVALAVTGISAADLWPLVVGLGGLVLLRALMTWAEMWLAHDLAYRVLAELRVWMYWALDRLAPGYLIERRSGDVASAAMTDIETIEWFYAHTAGTVVVAVLVVMGALIALGALHWLLPLALLPAVVLVSTAPLWLSRRAARHGQALRTQLGEVNADVVDSVQGLREIVAFGQGQTWLARLGQQSQTLVRTQLAHGSRAGLEGATITSLVSVGTLAVLALAAWFVAQGVLPVVLFPVSIVLAASVFGPMIEVTNVARHLNVTFASADRVFALLEAPAPVTDQVTQPPDEPIAPHVRFESISFRYQPALPDVLHGVTFDIAPGETVALVGHSGAGKSTCTHLLLRFWDVTSGAITIGGQDIRALPQATLRAMIALVPQDIYLFNTSIRDNIRLGNDHATDADVEAAAEMALAHEFLAALPQGYNTNAGERGAQLSGGQRQRIAIARAFLKNAPILVMDEAVSNLDTENERALQMAMVRLRAGRTTLIIAHRLSTIRSADRIIVLEQGRVAETGTHAELLQREGVYARLIASQRNGVLPDSL